MSLTINSNVSALNSLRRLSDATRSLSSISSHLSSGLRITNPSDDAAGLSIAESLKVDARVYSQGVRNLNDGISLLNTAEGALTQLVNIVTRQKELAEQAANGVYSSKQRLALNREANALVKEFNRIVRSTSFNGQSVIDGVSDSVRLQQGFGGNESTQINLSQSLGVAAGDGTFSGNILNVGADGASVPAIGDLNGDGRLDILEPSNSEINVYLQTSSGSFGPNSVVYFGFTPYNPTLADLNGDGRLDIVVSNQDLGEISILLGNGDGSFLAGQRYDSDTNTMATDTFPGELNINDFNGDGILDIAVANFGSSNVGVFLGNGNGTFRAARMIDGGGANVSDVESGDLNGDGVMDLVIGRSDGGPLQIAIGNGNGTFRAATSLQGISRPLDLALADFNGDGFLDIVSASSATMGAYVFLGNGNGTFLAVRTYQAAGAGSFTLAETADANGDGYLDLVMSDGSALFTFLGNGDGSFRSAISTDTFGNIDSAAAADINGDGIPDFVVTENGTSTRIAYGAENSSGRRNVYAYDLNLLTVAGAREALDRTTSLLSRINRELGDVGSYQSRLAFSLSNIEVRKLNYKDAASRISDMDTAEEASRLVSTKILQQSAVAVLAQANRQPEIALSLLV